MERLNIGLEAARKKIRHYCAYRERCHREVKNKLFEFGLYPNEVEQLIGELITENFLNEERYAIAYAGGHFRMKQWGPNKIIAGLRKQGISQYCIRKAMNSIDEDEFLATIQKLISKKWPLLKGSEAIKRKKLLHFLMQKGYGFGDVEKVISGK